MMPVLNEYGTEESEIFDVPEFISLISAVFRLKTGAGGVRSYDLNILNYSGQDLGLLVTEEEVDLLGTLKPGDKINDISLFADAALIKMEGTVKNKLKIKDGAYRGKYFLGLESERVSDIGKIKKGPPGVSNRIQRPMVSYQSDNL